MALIRARTLSARSCLVASQARTHARTRTNLLCSVWLGGGELLVREVQRVATGHVSEHSLQATRVLVAAHLLEAVERVCLDLVRVRHGVDETARQALRVHSLEHVLVGNVLEQQHHLIDAVLDLARAHALVARLHDRVAVLGQQLGRLPHTTPHT